MVDQLQAEQIVDTISEFTVPNVSTNMSDDGNDIGHVLQQALRTEQDALALLAPVRGGLELVESKLKAVDSDVFAPLASAFIELIDQGGKRLRPALALLVAGLHEETHDEFQDGQSLPDPVERISPPLVALSAAVEMLHTATLVHDDVIDGALLRRGAPTLNATWSPGATVLAGDYMFALSAQFAAETGSPQVIDIFSNTLQIIVDGEMRQLSERNDFAQEWQAYYNRIYAKTASLYSAATQAAAVLAGFSAEKVEALQAFGYHFGMAFQIVDDILDFVGDDATLGKPAGSDLRQGTLTLPFLYYLRNQADPSQLVNRLLQARGRAEDGEPQVLTTTVQEIVQAVQDSDGIPAARQEARRFLERASQALTPFRDDEHRRSLLGLCAFVVQRSS